MPQISFDITYAKNSDLIISPQEIRDIYMFGIDIKDQNGVSMDDETVKFQILAAQTEMENYLNVKLKRQIVDENLYFSGDDFMRWGYIKATYQVECPLSLEGFFNTTKQITYPVSWLSVKKTNDGKSIHRNISIVPSGDAATHSQALTISGIVPQLGYLGWRNIPNYWQVRYTSGFNVVPADIMNAIGKYIAIQLLHTAGDLVFKAGISSQSISLDGVSQSISTTNSGKNSIYGARISSYVSELDKILPRLRDYYRGFSFGVA
jgi:hypothetical protein